MVRRHRIPLALALTVLATSFFVSKADADTLQDARARGAVRCGVSEGPGFAMRAEDGSWSGFTVDMCRAVAAAALGDANKVTFEAIEVSTRFQALNGGEVDLLTEGTTWSLSRETDLGFDFPAVYFYEGQGFLALKSLGLKRLTDMKSGRICVVEGTTTKTNLMGFVRTHNMPVEIIPIESYSGSWDSFVKGRCEVLSNDRLFLGIQMATQLANPEDYMLLPDVISREPLAPVVRGDDRKWMKIVRYAVLAVIGAEELGVSSTNMASFEGSQDAQIMALIGTGEDHGAALGLEPGWLKRIVSQVGNYQEIFDRSFGTGLNLERGQNALWRDGGYIYAPPLY